jgi:hypothetical protein
MAETLQFSVCNRGKDTSLELLDMYRASAPFLLPRHSSQHIVHSTVHSTSTSFLSKTTNSIYLSITTSLLLCLFQPFVYPHPHVRLVSVYMGEQSNILILLL